MICRQDLSWRGKPSMEKRVWHFDEHTAVLLRPAEGYANAAEYLVRDASVAGGWTDEEFAAQIFKRIRTRMRRRAEWSGS